MVVMLDGVDRIIEGNNFEIELKQDVRKFELSVVVTKTSLFMSNEA